MNFFDLSRNPGPMIGAHRGYRAIRPENTLASFEAARGQCHYIEMDVQMSCEGVAVVHHDDILGRTCDIEHPARVDTLFLAELRQLDFGSWFVQKDPFGTLQNGTVKEEELTPLFPQRIMTFEELLVWRNRVAMPLNIEIKDQKGGKYDGAVVDAVLKGINKAKCLESVIISSFNHDYLKEISCKMPEVMLGALQEEENPPDICQYLRDIGASAYHPDSEIVNRELLIALRSNGFAVNVFTVNDRALQLNLLRDGATSIITDFPSLTIVDNLHAA